MLMLTMANKIGCENDCIAFDTKSIFSTEIYILLSTLLNATLMIVCQLKSFVTHKKGCQSHQHQVTRIN